MPDKTRALREGTVIFIGETTIVNEVNIEKWVYGGNSLARVEGRVVLVPFSLPGERVRIEVDEGIGARLDQILDAAPERVAAPCPVFGRCGGCHYQHAPYPFELSAKVEILREQLRRVGKIDYQGEIHTISGPDFGYRNRVQLHLKDGKVGYLAARSHELVPITDCPLGSPRLNQAIAQLRERAKEPRFPHFIQALELFTNETDLQVNSLETKRPVAKHFYESFNSVVALDYPTDFGVFRISPHSFFQVNRFLLNDLVRAAVPEEGGSDALDLYAGVGLFAVPLAKRFERVTAVEAGSIASRDLEFNAQRAGINLKTENARVEEFLPRLESTPDFVLADPPRAGLGKAVVAALNRLAPKRITIVSCDPATLARDLAALTAYKITRLTMVDLFPKTYHLETVVQLSL
jgi:23S rRNA (uracil1939-C5)-methyltransferase